MVTLGLEIAGADGSIEASGPKEALRVDRVGGRRLHFTVGFVKKQVFLWDHEHFY